MTQEPQRRPRSADPSERTPACGAHCTRRFRVARPEVARLTEDEQSGLARHSADALAARDEDCAGGVNFLAHEDVALKAHFETRRRYLGDIPPKRVFNQISEALPTIVMDGRVVDTWAWEGRGRRVRHRLVAGLVAAERQRRVRAAARELTGALRAGPEDGTIVGGA